MAKSMIVPRACYGRFDEKFDKTFDDACTGKPFAVILFAG